jgi:CheY-like chemotaxis protein
MRIGVEARRILVIDDDANIRELITELLRRLGYDVEQAADGRSGLRVLHASPPDLVLLDVSMPSSATSSAA